MKILATILDMENANKAQKNISKQSEKQNGSF